jgi:hypothetical protein
MSIDFQGFKTSDRAPRRLGELEEQRHVLIGIRAEEGQCIAKFPNGEFSFPAELREELADLVGKTVAVLRLDGYQIREVGP